MTNGSIVNFTRAVRAGSRVLISLESESGGGKTYSAILIGRGLVGPKGKLALLDTETGRGRTYAQLAGGYDYGELTPPFTPERYVAAIDEAERLGYECLIIDSASHEWEGIGGVIEAADSGTTKEGKALQGLIKWAQPKARHKRFVQSLLTKRMHLIICLRAKEKFVQRGNEIVSTGFVPIQDKGFKYEMTVRLFFPTNVPMAERGIPILEKCPEDLLGAFPAGDHVSIKTGELIAQWVASGEPVDSNQLALKRQAEEKAGLGSVAMKEWWPTLTKEQKVALAPFVPNLQSIAKVADEEIAAEREANAKLPSFAPVTQTAQPEVISQPAPAASTPPDNPFGDSTSDGDQPEGETAIFLAAKAMADRFCEGFTGGDVLTVEDLDSHRDVARDSINGTDIEQDEKELLLGQINLAYLERKKALLKLTPRKARAA